MSILKIRKTGAFVDICSEDVRIRVGNFWKKIKNGDKVFVNGVWKTIVCSLPFKWIIDPEDADCEPSPTIIDIPFELATPLFEDGDDRIDIEAFPTSIPVLKKNITTGNYIFDLKWIERNSAGVGPAVFNSGFTGGLPADNPYVENSIGRISSSAHYPAADFPFEGEGVGAGAINGHIDTNGYIWLDDAVSGAITAWNPSSPIYSMRVFNLDAESEFGGVNPIVNTGYAINPFRRKVSNDANEYPLDVNNQRTDGPEGSGLPQSTQAIDPSESDYRTLNLSKCPTASPSYGNAEQSGVFTKECTGTDVGSDVPYSIPPNTYYRSTQLAADNYAADQLAILGQQYANLVGTCSTDVLPCGTPTAFSGGESFPTVNVHTIGPDVSKIVPFNFDAVSVPDKFIIKKIDGTVLLDTGYRGDPGQQAALDAALAAMSLPSEPIVGPGLGMASFLKMFADTTVKVEVYAPISGTAWSYTLGCPAVPVGNEFRSGTFQKNDCPGGSSGTFVVYEVPADTHFWSDLDGANDMAEDDVDLNGQQFANDEGECLPDDLKSILVIDQWNYASLDAFLRVNTVGVTLPETASRDNNIILAGDEPENAYMLASDPIADATLKNRWEINFGRLIVEYPAINEFVVELVGRRATSGPVEGVYQLKNPGQKMTMTGTEGSYIPAIDPATPPSPIAWAGTAPGGGDGTIGPGDVIATWTLDVSANTVVVS
jgi:hypothetical protein